MLSFVCNLHETFVLFYHHRHVQIKLKAMTNNMKQLIVKKLTQIVTK